MGFKAKKVALRDEINRGQIQSQRFLPLCAHTAGQFAQTETSKINLLERIWRLEIEACRMHKYFLRSSIDQMIIMQNGHGRG